MLADPLAHHPRLKKRAVKQQFDTIVGQRQTHLGEKEMILPTPSPGGQLLLIKMVAIK